MATLLTKRSNTSGSVPLAAQLTNSTGGAELAVNTADKRLYVKDSGGTVVELGISPGSMPTYASGTANGVTYLNGSKVLTSGSALTFDGTNLTNSGSYISSGNAVIAVTSSANSVFIGGGGVLPANNTYQTTSNHIFQVGGSEQMRLTSTGLGIGNSNPTQKLEVVNASGAVTARIWSATNTSPIASLEFQRGTNATWGADAYGDYRIRNDTGALLFQYGENGTTTEQMRLTSTGLGIGVSSPTRKLDVWGEQSFQDSAGERQLLIANDTTLVRLFSRNRSDNSNVPMVFYTGATERLRIASDGNVGIGTSSPARKLDVVDNGNINATSAISNSTAGTSSLARFLAVSDAGSAIFGMTSSSYTDISGAQDAMLLNANSASGGVAFALDGVLRMKLDSSGNLGIGTSSPAAKLHVSGGRTLAITGNENYSLGVGRESNTNAYYLGVHSTSSPNLLFSNNAGTTNMTLTYDGNLGLGVTPSAWRSTDVALQVRRAALWDDGSNAMYLGQNVYENTSGNYIYIGSDYASVYRQQDGAHAFYTAASGTAGNAISFTQAMTLDASGNLVLGNTSALGKLDIGLSGATRRLLVTYDDSLVTVKSANSAANPEVLRMIGDDIRFNTGSTGSGTERARIDSSGNLLVGATSGIASERLFVSGSNANYIERVYNSNASPYGIIMSYTGAAPNGTVNEFFRCDDTGAVRMSVRSNGGIANYQANDVNLSDRREKTNFAPAKSYLETICAIPVQTFNYIDQAEDDPGLTLGVVAQDVQAVAPELVMESNWGTEEEPKMRLSIYQTDLQYALMKALQELKAEFDAYKASHP